MSCKYPNGTSLNKQQLTELKNSNNLLDNF